MSSLMFQGLDAYRHEDYGRPSTEISLQPEQDRRPAEPDRYTSLTIRIVLDAEKRVTLSNGESLREVQGSLTLQPSDEARPIASADRTRKQIGYVEYQEAYVGDTITVKAQYAMWALVPRSQFDEIVAALHDGQIPLTILVDIEGLELPDEFSAKWDNKAKRRLPMTSVKFSIPIANFPLVDLDEREQFPGLLPATKADIAVASEAITKLTQMIQTKLNWVVWLLVAVVVLLLVRIL